jgi:CHAT domain-containing protein
MQLPLHAAGVYAGDNQVSCSDYFVASYTPSLSALLNAQNTLKPLRRIDANALLVAVNNPFQGPILSMTTDEADRIGRCVPSKVVQASSCMDVLEHLQSASIVHFACHASQNPNHPLQSGFFLDDELLTVSKLMELELPNAFLAVLSACETAKGDATQPDQAIHLAGTMLFAGFKSIVATMWCVNIYQLCHQVTDSCCRYMGDLEGPVIAESIYSTLFNPNKESDVLDPNDVPYALDDAVQRLRSSGHDPNVWATYIHIGV